jgi:ligand-binding sensor domain-containing protein
MGPKRVLGLAVGGTLALAALTGAFVAWRASRALHESSQEVRAAREIRLTVRPYLLPTNIKFEIVRSPEVFLQAARFQDHFYIAGPAGLSEFDLRGTPLRQFIVGRDLPSSPLVTVAVGLMAGSTEPELVIATASDGLLIFNGRNFRQVYPADEAVRTITSILPVSAGHLLIGTKKRGVLLFDGKQIRELHPTLSNLYVQAMAGSEVDLWVGTLNQGVLHWHAGMTDTFGEEQGLPDRQVQAIEVAGEKTYVGTPLGVAEFDGGRFSRTSGAGLLVTSLLVRGDELLVGTEEQGVVLVPLAKRRAGAGQQGSAELQEVRQFLGTEDGVYVLTRSGVFELKPHGLGWNSVLKPGEATLSDRNISALATDKVGQLWVGYFDRGLDVLPNGAGRSVHVEDEHVFCVNRIWPDAKAESVAVATANGLVRFGASGKQEQVLTKSDGLIADHVTDVVAYREGLAIATPAGITFLDSTGARSMYAFQGLVNNHVYALGVSGEGLMAGTLGGLSMIDSGNVLRNYTAGNSGLKHNWITAVVRLGDEWMMGTYGGGIVGLDAAGNFRSYELATAPMDINPNAMLVTPRHVFAGTLGKGLYIYDREKSRWSAINEGLPSLNVTALAASEGTIYVGTDNGLVRVQEETLQP